MHYSTTLLGSSLVFLAALAPQVRGHSWVEQLLVIGSDNYYIGEPGYPRGYVPRNAPGYTDTLMENPIPPRNRLVNKVFPSDRMCRDSQSTPGQSQNLPALKAAPGSFIALRYHENGHVSAPGTPPGKPPGSGNVYIYGTTDPQPTDTLLSVLEWNGEGSGGDKRGRLLAVESFDDGQCYQISDKEISRTRQQRFPHAPEPPMGADLWCQNNIKLPDDAIAGKAYTLYWVWDWFTAPNVDPNVPKGKAEFYTTCMDVVVTNDVNSQPVPGAKDIGNRAVPNLMDGLRRQPFRGAKETYASISRSQRSAKFRF